MRNNTPKDYAVALFQATKDAKGDNLRGMLEQFASLLFRAGQVKQADKIIAEFIKYTKKQSGVIDIEIASARPLTAKLVEEIKKAFGNKVEATEKIEPELIGGVKIRTENEIFDASLKKQLQVLKQALS